MKCGDLVPRKLEARLREADARLDILQAWAEARVAGAAPELEIPVGAGA